jgi:hypothetical protein
MPHDLDLSLSSNPEYAAAVCAFVLHCMRTDKFSANQAIQEAEKRVLSFHWVVFLYHKNKGQRELRFLP